MPVRVRGVVDEEEVGALLVQVGDRQDQLPGEPGHEVCDRRGRGQRHDRPPESGFRAGSRRSVRRRRVPDCGCFGMDRRVKTRLPPSRRGLWPASAMSCRPEPGLPGRGERLRDRSRRADDGQGEDAVESAEC